MTSTPMTIRLKDGVPVVTPDIPAETPAGSQLQELNKNILDHAERIYKGEAEVAESGKSDLNTLLNTGRYDSKGNLRHNNAVWDGLGWLGGRGKVIQGLIADTNRREALLEGPDAQGRYQGLNWIDRHIHKITDEDMTKALHRWQIQQRNKDPELRKGLKELSAAQRSKVNSLTPLSEVQDMIQKERDYVALEERVRDMELGGYSLDQLVARNGGKRISEKDLKQLETDLIPLQSERIQSDQRHDSNLQTEAVLRDTKTGTLRLQEQQEANSNAIRRAEINYNNAKLQQDTDIANLKLKYEYDSANFDRELKRDLALLGLDSEREERQYRSERDRAQDRQLFILQLMKGLGGLGQSLGGY